MSLGFGCPVLRHVFAALVKHVRHEDVQRWRSASLETEGSPGLLTRPPSEEKHEPRDLDPRPLRHALGFDRALRHAPQDRSSDGRAQEAGTYAGREFRQEARYARQGSKRRREPECTNLGDGGERQEGLGGRADRVEKDEYVVSTFFSFFPCV